MMGLISRFGFKQRADQIITTVSVAMETGDVSIAALLEIQVILEGYLAYSLNAPDALDKILAIVDRPEVAHALVQTTAHAF